MSQISWLSVNFILPEPHKWVLVKAIKTENIEGPLVFVASCVRYGEKNAWYSAYGDGYIPEEVQIIE